MDGEKRVTRSQKEKEEKLKIHISDELGEQIAVLLHDKLEESERRTQKMCEAQVQHIEERLQSLTDMLLDQRQCPTAPGEAQSQRPAAPSYDQPQRPAAPSYDQPQQPTAPDDIQLLRPATSDRQRYYAAPTSVPEHGTRAGDRHARAQNFDGSVSWTAYCAQFEAIAHNNQWTDPEKAVHLAASLRGPALEILGHLPEEQSRDFDQLTAALKQRFGVEHQEEAFRARFRARCREPRESLPELAHDVERLGHLAYPSAPAEFKEILIRDQFVDALESIEMKLAVKRNRPASLREALACAIEMESMKMSFGRSEAVAHGSSGFRTRTADTDSSTPTDKALEPVLQGILSTLERLENRATRDRRNVAPSDSSPGNPHRRLTGPCWNCGRMGHLRRDCRTPRSQEASAQHSERRRTERKSEN